MRDKIFLRWLGIIYLLNFLKIWAEFPIYELRLIALYFIGTWLSIFLIAGRLNIWGMIGLWFCHFLFLLLVNPLASDYGNILLTEFGFISLFLFCHQKNHRDLAYWLFLWLIFRLMFESGICKLTSVAEPNNWHNLTASKFFGIQSIVITFMGWIWFQLPIWFHNIITISILVTECLLPFFILVNQCKKIIFFCFVGLQVGIIFISAIGLFNFLSIFLFTVLLWKKTKLQFPRNRFVAFLLVWIFFTGCIDIFTAASPWRKEIDPWWKITRVYRPFTNVFAHRIYVEAIIGVNKIEINEKKLPLFSLLPNYYQSGIYISTLAWNNKFRNYMESQADSYLAYYVRFTSYQEMRRTGKFLIKEKFYEKPIVFSVSKK